MSVESKIIENSTEKIKALAPRAAKAAKTPDTGVKIVVQGAYYVIRDCAQVTVDYLPLKLYGCYKNPIEELKGKFTKTEIESFAKRVEKGGPLKQLCNLMMLDAIVKFKDSEEPSEFIEPSVEDVYGDYGSDSVVEEEDNDFVLVGEASTKDIVDVLCRVFEAK